MRHLRPFVAFGTILATLAPHVAEARVSSEFPYPRDRVWNAAIRLMRVDFGCTLNDRDEESGFFMFEYPEGTRKHAGSLELVPTRVEGRDGVRVVVQIPNMPSYVERMISDRLGRKLVEDFGEPPPVRPVAREQERPREGERDRTPNAPNPNNPPAVVDENGDPVEPTEPGEG